MQAIQQTALRTCRYDATPMGAATAARGASLVYMPSKASQSLKIDSRTHRACNMPRTNVSHVPNLDVSTQNLQFKHCCVAKVGEGRP